MSGPDMLPVNFTTPLQGDCRHLFRQGPFLTPFQFTGWRDESLSWREGAYLDTSISVSPTFRIKGPDALKVTSDYCVNTPHHFPGGTGKHGIMCTDEGLVMSDGVMIRTAEDSGGIYMSQFRDEEPHQQMDGPNDMYYVPGPFTYHADRVLRDGRLVGISSGRAMSQYYRRMISLCSIDTEFSALGTKVAVLWGDLGTGQKEIRATVARFPYLDENRNQVVDVGAIPRAAAG